MILKKIRIERFFHAVFGFWHESRATSVCGVQHHLSKVLIRALPLCSTRCMLEENFVYNEFFNIISDLKPFFRNIKISNYNSSVSTSTFQSVACLTANWISLSLLGVVAVATPNDANKNSMFSWAEVSFSETRRVGAYWFWLMKVLVLETSLAARAGRIFFKDNSMMLLAVEARWTISISPALSRRTTDSCFETH